MSHWCIRAPISTLLPLSALAVCGFVLPGVGAGLIALLFSRTELGRLCLLVPAMLFGERGRKWAAHIFGCEVVCALHSLCLVTKQTG